MNARAFLADERGESTSAVVLGIALAVFALIVVVAVLFRFSGGSPVRDGRSLTD